MGRLSAMAGVIVLSAGVFSSVELLRPAPSSTVSLQVLNEDVRSSVPGTPSTRGYEGIGEVPDLPASIVMALVDSRHVSRASADETAQIPSSVLVALVESQIVLRIPQAAEAP